MTGFILLGAVVLCAIAAVIGLNHPLPGRGNPHRSWMMRSPRIGWPFPKHMHRPAYDWQIRTNKKG